MIELPHEIVFLISSYLNFRSLVRMSQTCQTYFQLLSGLIKIRKEDLFKKYTYVDENNGIEFVPGPAISRTLPQGFPINGVYFFEIGYHASGDINFFFENYFDFKCSSVLPHYDSLIATIKTEVKDTNNYKLGCHNFSSKNQIGYWNDLDVMSVGIPEYIGNAVCDYVDCDGECNYRCLFAKGKKVINMFWDSL